MKNIFEREKDLFLPVYNRIPLEIERGEGVYLVDKKGDRYLDFFSGLAVNALGYAHPKIVKAVSDQISKFAHLSNNFITDIQIEFAERLLKYSGMSKVFLSNSGTESIEGALKMIRYIKGPDKIIYSLTNSFHGRTYGALTLTAREKYRQGFEPLLPNISHIKFNDVRDLELNINKNTAAIIFEFIQGEGGINEVSAEFLSKLMELKQKHGFLLIADAIQDGIGRSGKPFVHNYFDIEPDFIICAKAIGGGLPLGAILLQEKYTDIMPVGKHGTTFGGNPVSCAAGNAVLQEVFENGLMNKVYENGNYFIAELKKLKDEFPQDIKEVRGRGYMIGVELYYDGADIVRKMRSKKILMNCTHQTVLRLLPPLIATKEHIEIFLSALRQTFNEKN
ncbi:MAG TPA: acetylornithine/succinylornithine family transaminase [Ignavibacteriales bacterium]|nr:acetylornithine/succinylornithine family transaminase [Ignavibacteriales bacterium]